jgi:hypothetical protein
MSTANDLTQAAKDEFLNKNRNLLALTQNGPNDVFKRISASLALNTDAQANVMFYANPEILAQKGYAGEVARDSFKREMYREICAAFIRIQRNHVVTFAAKLTPEALAELEAIEVVVGVRQAPEPVAPPPPPRSAQELLEEEVRRDWKHLRTSEVKRKLNNKAYKETFDRLMNAGELESVATTYTDNGVEFRQ